MICSVLIPTRGRVHRLKEALRSLRANATTDNWEVLLKVDDDDHETISELYGLREFGRIKTFIGPRLDGYASLNLFYSLLANVAAGQWVYIFNDDCTIIGQGWDEKLSQISIPCIVHAEYDMNGGSIYARMAGGPFPIVPNRIWKRLGYSIIPDPVDKSLDRIIRLENKMPTVFLDGIVVAHDRKEDATLTPDRL